MLGLDFCAFDNFLFLALSLRCHEALINLFPHLHELNLATTALYATKKLFLTCFCISCSRNPII